MRVSIYKLPEGRIDILVEAAVGHGKPPITLQKVTRETLRDRLNPVLEVQRGRRKSQAGDE